MNLKPYGISCKVNSRAEGHFDIRSMRSFEKCFFKSKLFYALYYETVRGVIDRVQVLSPIVKK